MFYTQSELAYVLSASGADTDGDGEDDKFTGLFYIPKTPADCDFIGASVTGGGTYKGVKMSKICGKSRPDPNKPPTDLECCLYWGEVKSELTGKGPKKQWKVEWEQPNGEVLTWNGNDYKFMDPWP